MLTNNIARNPRKDIMVQKNKKQNVHIETDATRKLSQRINIQMYLVCKCLGFDQYTLKFKNKNNFHCCYRTIPYNE